MENGEIKASFSGFSCPFSIDYEASSSSYGPRIGYAVRE